VLSVGVSSEGLAVAIASRGGPLRLHDAETGARVAAVPVSAGDGFTAVTHGVSEAVVVAGTAHGGLVVWDTRASGAAVTAHSSLPGAHTSSVARQCVVVVHAPPPENVFFFFFFSFLHQAPTHVCQYYPSILETF
jgi:hypothetical protein